STIFDLNHFCYFALFKQIRLNCEQTNKSQQLDDFKYMDLKNFLSIDRGLRQLFYEWDKELSERLFLLDVSSMAHICIDFAELYERLKGFPEKVKKNYWKSLTLAIEENEHLASVELRYYPKTHNSEHMDVFESVMKRLRAKKDLKKPQFQFPGYTLEDLHGFENLEELLLDANIDIKELTECCRNNKEITHLMVGDHQSGGRRLADIVPFCGQVRKFDFKMKFACDASEYAPLAKMPKLEKLHIWGEHERGTLQALFGGLARREPGPLLSTLFVDDASLVSAETTELSRIKSLTKLRYRCNGPQDIGPLNELTNLKNVDILSHHDFSLIGDQICRILHSSQRPRKVYLPGCLIRYNPKEDALLLVLMQNHDATDYGSLLRLPNLNSFEINGHQKPGTLVKLFDELARVEVPTLMIRQMNAFVLMDFIRRGWKRLPYPDYPLINAQEIVALSRCKSLRTLIFGISDTQNIELLAELSQLRSLTITTKPVNGSLVRLFKYLAASKSPSLRDFQLSTGNIDCQEASALAQIGSLKSLNFNYSDADDLELLSSFGWVNLETLRIFLEIEFHEISNVILKASQFCGKWFKIRTQDVAMEIDRQQKDLLLRMNHRTIYSIKTMLHPLSNLEWVESLYIDIKPFNLSLYFKAISMSGNCQLKKFHIHQGFLDSNETLELGKIKSLKKFHGKLVNTQSLEHLRLVSHLEILDSFENRLPKEIVPILDSIEEELTISLRDKEVSYNIKTGHLILNITDSYRFSRSSNDATDFAPLARLKNLQSVQIFGSHMGSSLQLFFSQLASRQCQTLQGLVVGSKQTDPDLDMLTISSSELEEIASIKSLRKLKCGFLEAQNLDLIGGLPQLTELIITTHQEGSLKDLLRKINSMESPRLEYLVIEGGQLTAEEEVQVAAMKSLKRVECSYSSTVAFDYQGQSTGIEAMTVTKDRQDISLVELFRNRPCLKSLIHSLATFGDTANGDTIARLPQDIQRDLLSFDGFEGVVQCLDPQRLVIELPPEMHCLKFLLEALALNESQNLQQLIIRHRYIGLEEAAAIAHISSLKILMCGLEDSSALSYLCKLKHLESLKIRSLNNFSELSQHLICLLQSCEALESIDLDFWFPMQYINGDFLLQAANTLKSVRNSKTQSPLKLRFPP
ncbi:hypothetical protein KR038_002400, partial [Drosophila bunnanda]